MDEFTPRTHALNKLTAQVQDPNKNAWPVSLPLHGAWPPCRYRMDRPMVQALRAAIGAGRPLLIQGEPGAGKSHLARAAAVLCERYFMSVVIQPNTEYEELLWTVDHTERLGQAHRLSTLPVKVIKSANDPLAMNHFVCPGPLWHAFDFNGQKPPNRTQFMLSPSAESRELANNGIVLLLDEIDKADATLCNGLLEAFGNGGFDVPPLGRSVRCPPCQAPLVVMTSNRTRMLPPAFLRRCVMHEIVLPEGDALIDHLVLLGRVQFIDNEDTDYPSCYPWLKEKTLFKAARLVVDDRNRGVSGSPVQAGVAEYLDLLRAVAEHRVESEREQIELVDAIANFFHKRP